MSRIRLSPSGHEIEAEPGDTILSALERAGFALDNNCRAGACGECKTRVLAGDYDQGMVLSMALSTADREAGYGLMCMATPLSDVVEIDYGTLDARPRLFPPRTGVPHVIVDRVQRTPRMIELRLRPLGEPLRYWPGQYVLLGDQGAGIPPRSYSLASAPRPDGELVLLVTRVPDGVTSGWLHGLAVGDDLAVDGPYGTFIGDPTTDTPVVCLAAGSGLAPILSLADAALRRGFPHPVTLVVSARTPEDDVAVGLMRWWERVHPNVQLIITHTRVNPCLAPGVPDRRIPAILPSLFDDLSGTSVFIAGSPGFVTDCLAAARALGARDELTHTEGHTSGAEVVTPAG